MKFVKYNFFSLMFYTFVNWKFEWIKYFTLDIDLDIFFSLLDINLNPYTKIVYLKQ